MWLVFASVFPFVMGCDGLQMASNFFVDPPIKGGMYFPHPLETGLALWFALIECSGIDDLWVLCLGLKRLCRFCSHSQNIAAIWQCWLTFLKMEDPSHFTSNCTENHECISNCIGPLNFGWWWFGMLQKLTEIAEHNITYFGGLLWGLHDDVPLV